MHPPALIQRLKSIESKLEQMDYEAAQQKARIETPISFDTVRRFVVERLAYLPELARIDPEKAKAAFQKHLALLVLTPVQRETGEVFEVSGTWKLVPELHVMPVVARDGIEPPTPAFSGPRSSATAI